MGMLPGFLQRQVQDGFPAGWYQSINSIFLILLAPAFSWLWLRMGSRQPSSPTKFSIGLVFVGIGAIVLALASMSLGGAGSQVGPYWLIGVYLMHTIGELCLSPVGLSTTTKLAPARLTGLMMGVWFLSISVGNYLGGKVAGFYSSFSLPTLFGTVGAFAILSGLILALFIKPIVRLMGGVK